MAVQSTGQIDRRGFSQVRVHPVTGKLYEPYTDRARRERGVHGAAPGSSVTITDPGMLTTLGGRAVLPGGVAGSDTGKVMSQDAYRGIESIEMLSNQLYDKYKSSFVTHKENLPRTYENFYKGAANDIAKFYRDNPTADPKAVQLALDRVTPALTKISMASSHHSVGQTAMQGAKFALQVGSWAAPFLMPPGVGEAASLGAKAIGGPMSAVGGMVGAIGPASGVMSSAIPAGMSLVPFSPGWSAAPSFGSQIGSTIGSIPGPIKGMVRDIGIRTLRDATTPKTINPITLATSNLNKAYGGAFSAILDRQQAGRAYAINLLDKDGLLPAGVTNLTNPMNRAMAPTPGLSTARDWSKSMSPYAGLMQARNQYQGQNPYAGLMQTGNPYQGRNPYAGLFQAQNQISNQQPNTATSLRKYFA